MFVFHTYVAILYYYKFRQRQAPVASKCAHLLAKNLLRTNKIPTTNSVEKKYYLLHITLHK